MFLMFELQDIGLLFQSTLQVHSLGYEYRILTYMIDMLVLMAMDMRVEFSE